MGGPPVRAKRGRRTSFTTRRSRAICIVSIALDGRLKAGHGGILDSGCAPHHCGSAKSCGPKQALSETDSAQLLPVTKSIPDNHNWGSDAIQNDRAWIAVGLLLAAGPAWSQTQANWWSAPGREDGPSRTVWAARKTPETPYGGPNKPIWRIADILKAHAGQKSWEQQSAAEPRL